MGWRHLSGVCRPSHTNRDGGVPIQLGAENGILVILADLLPPLVKFGCGLLAGGHDEAVDFSVSLCFFATDAKFPGGQKFLGGSLPPWPGVRGGRGGPVPTEKLAPLPFPGGYRLPSSLRGRSGRGVDSCPV